MTQDLQDRMRRHTPGQVTWPDLSRDRRCATCKFFFTGDARMSGKGRCDQVRLRHKTLGAQFVGDMAIGCSLHEAGKHEGNKK
jgi:hypothetical protein